MEVANTRWHGKSLNRPQSKRSLRRLVYNSVPMMFADISLGNGGTETEKKVKNVDIGVTEFDKLVKFALENKINLVVPGPEVPLVAGVETHFRKGLFLVKHLLLTLQWEYHVSDQLKKPHSWKDQKPSLKLLCFAIIFQLQSPEYPFSLCMHDN